MTKKMNGFLKFALIVGGIVAAVFLFRSTKVKKWTVRNVDKLRDSPLAKNAEDLSDWGVDRIYELRDPDSKTSRLVHVFPAGNLIQRAVEFFLPDRRNAGATAQTTAQNTDESKDTMGDKDASGTKDKKDKGSQGDRLKAAS